MMGIKTQSVWNEKSDLNTVQIYFIILEGQFQKEYLLIKKGEYFYMLQWNGPIYPNISLFDKRGKCGLSYCQNFYKILEN